MTGTKLGEIRQIALNVSESEKSVEFYGEILGNSKIFDAPKFAFCDNAGVRLMPSTRKR